MKRMVQLIVLAVFILSFAACGSSKHYTVYKEDGSSIVSNGEPKYEKNSDSYRFENLDGNEVILQKDKIKEIKENKN